MKSKNYKIVLYIIFTFSGMAALIYEVVWARQLTLIFGTTVFAISTVLGVFMAGLAIGSLLFGRIIDKSKSKNSIKIYGYLEGAIGLYVLFTPFIFRLIGQAQIYLARYFSIDFFGFSIIRFILTFLALIIPTVLIGGTFPIMVKIFVRLKEEIGRGAGQLYALNTFGGVLGVILVGFFLILLLGVHSTVYLAAGINLIIAVIFFSLVRKIDLASISESQSEEEGEDNTTAQSEDKKIILAVLTGFSFAGFASLGLEVIWTRVLVMILGSSVYAFSIILATFLLGIALGSAIISRFVDRFRNLVYWFVAIDFLIGILVIIFSPLFGYLPFLFLKIYRVTGGNFFNLQFFEFLLIALIIILPTLLMGAAFPIVAKICTQKIEKAGSSIGNKYFLNTLGGVLGSLITGFIFITLFGLQTSILILAGIYLVISGIVFVFLKAPKKLTKILVSMCIIGIICSLTLLSKWNIDILNSGVYIYASTYLENNFSSLGENKTLYYKEGLSATVKVEKGKDNNLTLRVGGKADAGTTLDMDTQLISGHLPMLLHPDPKKVLVIGLGSGITLGAVEQYKGLERVDLVEIEPAIIEAAAYFSEYNNNALDDQKLNVIIGDGRNYTLINDKKYDVITAEPSNPWVSGNANLFTKEQFEIYKTRLKDGGIMFQWAHVYGLSINEIKTIVATFQEVFPHTVIWQDYEGLDLFMIGTEEPLKIDIYKFEEKFLEENIRTDLARAKTNDPLILLNYFILDEQGTRDFTKNAELHTDNYPVLEFKAVKGLYLDQNETSSINRKELENYRSDIYAILSDIKDEDVRKKIDDFNQSRKHVMRAEIYLSQGEGVEKWIQEYEKALSLTPDNASIKQRLAKLYVNLSYTYYVENMPKQAESYLIKAAELDPEQLIGTVLIPIESEE